MHLLRASSGHLAAQRRKAGALLLTLAGAGAVVTAALGATRHPLAGALAGVALGPAVAGAYRRRRRFERGVRGESEVAQLLQSLPNDYFLLNDVVLPGHPGTIDHVVIGPCGVVVVETANYSGGVASRRESRSAGGRPGSSVSGSGNRAAIAVREALTGIHPELGDSALRVVDSIAVFGDPSGRVSVDRARTAIARYSQLLDVILAKARRKRVSPAIAARLAESLLEALSDGDSRPADVPARAAARG